MNRFDAKDPTEKVTLTFDFTNGLASGETLTGTPTTVIAVTLGTDPTPNAILNGAVVLDPTQKKVYVSVQGGINDTDYQISITVSTTNAAKVLALTATLPVRI